MRKLKKQSICKEDPRLGNKEGRVNKVEIWTR